MTAEFRRRKTSARGGFTPAEREKVDELLRLWARRSSRTTPINPGKIIRAITGIYKIAGLRRPHIAIAASPLEMAFAYGAALAAWDARNASIKQSLDCEKPDPVLAALKRMTTANSCVSLCDFVCNEICRAAEPPSFGDQLPSLTATRC